MKSHSRLYRLSVLTVYVAVAISFGTGLAWLVLDSYFQKEGSFGMEKHPAQFYLIRIHGGMAMGMMMIFGGLLATHVRHYWRKRRSRISGLTLIVTLSLLIASAFVLYYASADSLLTTAHWTHIVVGIGLPLWLIVHVVQRKTSTIVMENNKE